MDVFADLKRRAESCGPVRIAVIGTGYFGSGVIRRSAAIAGLQPALAANRTLDRALAALAAAGLSEAAVCVTDDPRQAQAAIEQGRAVATSDLHLPAQVPGIDAVVEATGDVEVGAELAFEAIRHGKHVVAANPEAQATVGPVLKTMADEMGVVYSDVDGDEPGILADLVRYARGIGFDPLIAGNCKGVLKRYATPATQAEFAAAHGLKPWIATAAADGTKLNLEMTVVANATGMPPAAPGMTGPTTSLETVLDDLRRLGLLDGKPAVEFTLGIPNGVFVVFRSDEPVVQADLRYLKMGDGPFYLLHRPHVLIHYAAPLSAAEAVLYGWAAVTPAGAPVADTITFAKRDMRAGTVLDGIGGFDCYGLIVPSRQGAGMLPVGLAKGARLERDIRKDEPIPEDAVEVRTGEILQMLRRRQAEAFSAPRPAGSPALAA